MSMRAAPLARALAAQGHAVTILIPPWDDPERAGQAWEDNGVRIINVSLPPAVPLLFHMLLTRSLIQQALALQPDVIHLFKPKAYAGLAHWALWQWRRLGENKPAPAHTAGAKNFLQRSAVSGQRSYFPGRKLKFVLDTDDWEQAWNDISPYSTAQKRFFSWQERWGLRHADAITVASRELERLVKPYSGATPIFYLPNGYPAGIDFESLDRNIEADEVTALRKQWRVGNAPLILLYSRFLEFRLARVVTLVRYVAKHLPQARWLMVGRGLQGEDTRLAVDLQQAGLADYARFVGWLPLEQLPVYFKAADVAVYPYDDTVINRTKCSVKLIDLLAAGVPVVADAVGQNCEYIEPGLSGVLVQAEDDAAFGQAVIQLLRNPALARTLGQAAARRIREEFTWQARTRQIEEVYR